MPTNQEREKLRLATIKYLNSLEQVHEKIVELRKARAARDIAEREMERWKRKCTIPKGEVNPEETEKFING